MSAAIRTLRSQSGRRRVLAVAGILIGVVGVTVGMLRDTDGDPPDPDPVLLRADQSELDFTHRTDPDRTVVRDQDTGKVLAKLTAGARTAVLTGPVRNFSEPESTDATVTTNKWVRVLPQPWSHDDTDASWFRSWLDKQSQSTEPDVLAVAFQYVTDAPDKSNSSNVRFRGEAKFGPLNPQNPSYRDEATDFYEYLGREWKFPDGNRETPDPERYGSVDCSGYIRLVYGYRMGLDLHDTNKSGPGLPRRAFAIAKHGPGTAVIPDRGHAATAYDRLLPGDLVFFDPYGDDQIDHAGIYMGVDSEGHHRFISSRGTANGPTMGDLGGLSLLDGGGLYSRNFRTARRL